MLSGDIAFTLCKNTGSENSAYIKLVSVIEVIVNAGGIFSLQV